MTTTNEVSGVKVALTEKVSIQDGTENTGKAEAKGTKFSPSVFSEVTQNKSDFFPNLSLGKTDKTNDVTHNSTNTNISAQSSVAEKVKKAGAITFIVGIASFFAPLGTTFGYSYGPIAKKFMLGGLILGVTGLITMLGAKLYSEHGQENK